MPKGLFKNCFSLYAFSAFISLQANVVLPHFDHIVIVMEENHSYNQVVGSQDMPYINSLINNGALFTNSYAVSYPGSQANYLAIFSGYTQHVGDEFHPKFHAECLGSLLLAAGKTFVGYSEGLPSAGFNGISSGAYVRRHNPFTQFTTLPDSANQPFTAFPKDFHHLPTISFVVPDLSHDGHNGSLKTLDAWLKKYMSAYASWAVKNNSLLIVTFDEPGRVKGASKNIPTFFYGAHVKKGIYNKKINHYSILRTLEDLYDLPPLGNSAKVNPITDVWN